MDNIVLDNRYKEQIIKFLGYEDKKPNAKILNYINEEIKNSLEFIEPKFYSKKYKIKAFEKTKVILENDQSLSGEYIVDKLKECDYIYVNVATIGDEIDSKIGEYFKSREIIKSLILDKIGVVSLDKLVDLKRAEYNKELIFQNVSITCEIYPGDFEWSIQNQKIIFELLKSEKMQVYLNTFYMMNPIKSVAFIWGIGKGKTYRCENRCSLCKNKCKFRV